MRRCSQQPYFVVTLRKRFQGRHEPRARLSPALPTSSQARMPCAAPHVPRESVHTRQPLAGVVYLPRAAHTSAEPEEPR